MDDGACPTCKGPIPADAPGGACPRCLMALAFATDAGGLAPDASPADVERRFAGYEVLGTIGRGGMGTVFRARQRALDREVALKVLPGGPGRPAGFTERFEREAKALARLQHPGIVQVFDFGTSADGWCYLAMELVEGVNLRRALADGRLAAKQALAIVPQICDALQYAHDHGVVHRDIKPENLLLTKDGRVKVADFGLAKLVQDARIASLTHTGHSMGTPLYMAPEQVEHPGDVDHRADIYSLGVVFYEMLTGELPIGRFAAPSQKSGVNARIDDIVLRTLEKEREARFQRVDEVKTRIDEAAQAEPRAVPAAPAPRPVRVVDAAAEKTLELQQALFTSRGSGSKVSKFALLVPVAAFAACCFVEGNRHSVMQTWMFTVPAIAVLMVVSLIAWGRIRRSGGAMHGIGYAAIGAVTALVLVPVTIFTVASYRHSTWPAPVTVVDPVVYERRTAAFRRDQTAIRNLVQRAMALRPVTKLDALRDFYTAADFAVLSAMDEKDRLARGEAGQLGLPMMSDDFLEGIVSPSELVLQDATPTDDTAVVQLYNNSLMSVTAHLVRDEAAAGMSAENGWPQDDASRPRWRFALVPLGKHVYANAEVQRRLRRPPVRIATPDPVVPKADQPK